MNIKLPIENKYSRLHKKSITFFQVQQYNTNQIMSDLDSNLIHKFFRLRFSSIKNEKRYRPTCNILTRIYEFTIKKLLSGVLRFCVTNAKFNPTTEKAFRVKDNLKLIDICTNNSKKKSNSQKALF